MVTTQVHGSRLESPARRRQEGMEIERFEYIEATNREP